VINIEEKIPVRNVVNFYPYKIKVTEALQVLMTWADGTARLQ
jgi:hypothetical protein